MTEHKECRVTDLTKQPPKLSDFVESNALHFVCRGKKPPEFVDDIHKQAFFDKLFSALPAEWSLTANNLCKPPLTPGHTYHLRPAAEQTYPDLLLLTATENNPEKGGYVVSPMHFLNAFADSSIPGCSIEN